MITVELMGRLSQLVFRELPSVSRTKIPSFVSIVKWRRLFLSPAWCYDSRDRLSTASGGRRR
jgi:hypothetical protein